MTDIPVGWALWNDLVRQIAVPARIYDDAEDLPHTAYLKLVRYRAQTPVDNGAALPMRTAISANIDNCRRSKALNYIEIAERRSFPRIAHWRDSSEPRGGVKGVRIIEIN